MGIEQRRHIRFSLDIPAIRYRKDGEAVAVQITQISLGGCLAEWDDKIYLGDEFRMLVQLPNKNYLPIACKAIYKFPNNGIGTRFLDLTLFEQELVAKVISHTLKEYGVPLQIDPFAQPKKMILTDMPHLNDVRREQDEMLDKIL